MDSGAQSEREEKVSLELTEEILQSMEVGMTFRDYVILLILHLITQFQKHLLCSPMYMYVDVRWLVFRKWNSLRHCDISSPLSFFQPKALAVTE